MNFMNMWNKKEKMEPMRAQLINWQKMRMDWEDKNIIMAFLKDSLKGQIKVDGLEKSILMAAISKDFIY